MNEEETEPQYAYIFQIRPSMEGLVADRFVDVSIMVGHTADSFKDLLTVYEQMGMERENIDRMKDRVSAVQSVFARSAFTGSKGVYMIRTDSPITAENMDAYLTMRQREDTIQEFMREAKIA